jgi:hypothetical protein
MWGVIMTSKQVDAVLIFFTAVGILFIALITLLYAAGFI